MPTRRERERIGERLSVDSLMGINLIRLRFNYIYDASVPITDWPFAFPLVSQQ